VGAKETCHGLMYLIIVVDLLSVTFSTWMCSYNLKVYIFAKAAKEIFHKGTTMGIYWGLSQG